MFTLPTTAVADITGKISSLFGDFWVIIALMVGIPLGFYILRKVIETITGETGGGYENYSDSEEPETSRETKHEEIKKYQL